MKLTNMKFKKRTFTVTAKSYAGTDMGTWDVLATSEREARAIVNEKFLPYGCSWGLIAEEN